MRDKYKIAMTSAPVFSNNMGCNALTYGSLVLLGEASRRLEVEFEYVLCGNKEFGIVPLDLKEYNINFLASVPDYTLKAHLKTLIRRRTKTITQYFNVLKSCDIFIDNAWGDSFSDIYGIRRYNGVINQQSLGPRWGKPLILFPQTIGPFSDKYVENKASDILNKATYIYTRDPLSTEYAKKLMSDVDLFETIDVAFFMKYVQMEKAKDQNIIGINPSGLLWQDGYTRANEFGLKHDYKETIREIVKILLEKKYKVVFVGHDINGPSSGCEADDYYVCKKLVAEFPGTEIAPFFYSPIEAKSYISSLDGLIGSRMHCCIAAYSSGVPVLPLAYSRKFKGLFCGKLDYEYVSELTDKNIAELKNDVSTFIKDLPNISTEMPERLKMLLRYKSDMLNNLTNTLESVLK